MPGSVGRDLHAVDVHLLVKVDDLDAPHALLHVLLAEERLGVIALLVQLDEVVHEHREDRLRRVGHQDPALKVGPPDDERHRGAVVEVEVGDEHGVHGAQVHLIEVRERGDAGVPGVHAAVEHDGLVLVGREDAGAADLGARAEGHDLEHVVLVGDIHADGALEAGGNLDRSSGHGRHDRLEGLLFPPRMRML